MSRPIFGHLCRAVGLTGRASEVHQFDQPVAFVGRAALTDLLFDHPSVSRRHALLLAINGRALYVDLGSRAGVGWGDSRARAGWLSPGEAIAIGD